MARRAFTLIELLVVIAIIAVLAALLFPVFARAKIAAKGAASLANIRNLGLAETLYAADHDDRQLLGGNDDADGPYVLDGVPFKSWGWLLIPYAKSYAVFQDPLTTMEDPIAEAPNDLVWAYRTQFGYAFTIHSPCILAAETGRYEFHPLVATEIAEPARTVLFTKKKVRNAHLDGYWIGSLVWGANMVNPPTCASLTTTGITPQSVCVPSNFWGTGATSYEGQSFEEGGLTGGVAWRKNGRTLVTWADGHAGSATVADLAAGTNYTLTTPATEVRITDRSRFVWDSE